MKTDVNPCRIGYILNKKLPDNVTGIIMAAL